MSRPPVSVIVPFAGTREQATAVLAMLHGLETRPDDELILADNSGTAPPLRRDEVPGQGDATGCAGPGEASASHARNAGAAAGQQRLDPVPRLRRDSLPPDLLDQLLRRACR